MSGVITVVAFGGNAMMRAGESGSPEEQIAHARSACRPLVELVRKGAQLVLVHGNGPQVGRELDRSFHARARVPPLPLDVCVAATQGTMGYFLEIALRESLREGSLSARIATLATLVRVDEDDPAFLTPDKPVGPFYPASDAERIARERHVQFVDDAGRGHRQVVPSPMPREILDVGAIHALLAARHVVIACGGGGIPVVRAHDGSLVGIEAVIDKDHSASLLGRALGAKELVDLTSVDFVYRDYGTPQATPIPHLRYEEAAQMLADGYFPAGSMGPKIAAACSFLEGSGTTVLVSSMTKLEAALRGEVGTRITRT